MSHHFHLPPEVDEAIRTFIRRHKRGLRWGCLAALLLVLVISGVAAWTLFRGAVHVKDWVTGNERAQVNPQGMVNFFAAMKAERDVKGPGGFARGANLLSIHPTPQERIDRLKEKQALLARREFQSFEADFQALREILRATLEQP
jgi:hypothetical protein